MRGASARITAISGRWGDWGVVQHPGPRLRRPQRQPASAADALKDEYRERDDDQYDENGPQHGEAPSLACLKRRNPGSRGGFASQPVADATGLCPENPTSTRPLSRQVFRRRASTAGSTGGHLASDVSARRLTVRLGTSGASFRRGGDGIFSLKTGGPAGLPRSAGRAGARVVSRWDGRRASFGVVAGGCRGGLDFV